MVNLMSSGFSMIDDFMVTHNLSIFYDNKQLASCRPCKALNRRFFNYSANRNLLLRGVNAT